MLEAAGFEYERIFFVPNNVSDEEMKYAIERNIMTSLDSLAQLRRYGKLNKGGKCAVRINPGVGAGHHEKVVTGGKKTKFGISEEDIDEIFEIAKEYNLTIAGINQHIGSLFMEPTPYLEAVSNLLRIAKRFKNLEFIDFGGGYGIPYHKLDDEAEYDIESFKERLEPILDKFVEEYGYAPLFKSEPGRFCVAEGSVLLGRVYATKINAGKEYAGTDIGMNVLVRPSMYDSWHDAEIIRNGKVVKRDNLKEITICGNICESGDLLCKERPVPDIKEEDIVCLLDTGAYGYSLCSNYNSRPRPAEVLITKTGEDKVIRKRETYEDLLRHM
ncbi:MAG: diaminopimelate decarboxylase, partial [Lachnospiraceae bacterium]|nr:diaminopimelate decarboxylase [Lachnospiraceae bacterium]